jgi:hypothetical protein
VEELLLVDEGWLFTGESFGSWDGVFDEGTVPVRFRCNHFCISIEKYFIASGDKKRSIKDLREEILASLLKWTIDVQMVDDNPERPFCSQQWNRNRQWGQIWKREKKAHNNVFMRPWAGDKSCVMNITLVFSSQAYRMYNDVTNTS